MPGRGQAMLNINFELHPVFAKATKAGCKASAQYRKGRHVVAFAAYCKGAASGQQPGTDRA